MLNTIETLHPAVAKSIFASNARNKAKEARMAFGTLAHPIDAKLAQIVRNNANPITQEGFGGAYQVFAHLHSSTAKKVNAAKQLLTVRKTIRFHKIYAGKDVRREGWTFTALDYVGTQRRAAMVA